MFGKRILVLAAHPDDEVVACAAAIGRAKDQGATIAVRYLTNGCISREDRWSWDRKNYQNDVRLREAESEKAASVLGVLPLGVSKRPARALWRELPMVFDEVCQVLDNVKPDQIWVPAYEGGNPDHDALNAIGFVLKSRASVLEFSEYNFSGGKVRSQELIGPFDAACVLALTPREQAAKRAAMNLYGSEKSNLSMLKTEQENYRPIADHDYSKPPHPGRLWYMRFQWVPFRHPRVDYTSAHEVCAAINAFLEARS